jgi:hypothetical protein
MYTEILESAKLWFPQPSHDICGRPTSPIKLKLLGADLFSYVELMLIYSVKFRFDGYVEKIRFTDLFS